MPVAKTPLRTATKRAVPRSQPAAAPATAVSSAPVGKPAQAAKVPRQVKAVKVKSNKPPKPRKKPVRDSFTMPEADFSLIATLKARALAANRETKKSELLRAGLHALAALETGALLAALGALEPVKVGRPKSGR